MQPSHPAHPLQPAGGGRERQVGAQRPVEPPTTLLPIKASPGKLCIPTPAWQVQTHPPPASLQLHCVYVAGGRGSETSVIVVN